jgi:hypothetical protein
MLERRREYQNRFCFCSWLVSLNSIRYGSAMTDDQDELRYEQEIAKKDPRVAIAAIEEIEVQLRYGIPRIKLLVWIVIILLGLILWRVW